MQMLVIGSRQPWGSYHPSNEFNLCCMEYVDLWQMHLLESWTPPLTAFLIEGGKQWKYGKILLRLLHCTIHQDSRSRSTAPPKKSKLLKLCKFCKNCCRAAIDNVGMQTFGNFPRAVMWSEEWERGGRESFAKCGKNLKVDQATVGKRLTHNGRNRNMGKIWWISQTSWLV